MSVSMDSTATSQADTSPFPATAELHQHERHQPTPSVTPHAPPQQQPMQSQQREEDDDEEEWLMACRCENGQALLTLLSCLQHVSEGHASDNNSKYPSATTQSNSSRRSKKHQIQPVTVYCSPSRFTFHVFGPAKQSEVNLELQKSMFTQYQVLSSNNHNKQKNDNADDADEAEDWQAGGEFCVNLTTVLESLQLLGSLDRTKVFMTYNLQQEIFKLELLQDDTGVICTAAIPGLMTPDDAADGEDSLSNAYGSAPLAVRMMVRSGILKELLPEWSHVAGASCVSVAVSQAKGLEIAVLGHYGECWVQIPPIGDHLVSPLELVNPKETVTRTYPLHSLLSSMRGLEIAEETCININVNGIMAIQHKTIDPMDNGCPNFVDFFMTCLQDEDEDNEGDGEDTATQLSASQGTFRTWDRHTTATQQQRRRQPESPAETTATTKATRRRRKQKSPTQDAAEDEAEEYPVHGTSDMEDDEDTPRSRQKRQSRHQRTASLPPHSLEEDEEEDDEDDDPPPISAGPLFGTVVREPAATSSTTPPRRRQRRSYAGGANKDTSQKGRKRKNKKKRKSPEKEEDQQSDASKDLLADTSEEEADQGGTSSDEEHDEEALDITALAGSPVAEGSGRTNDECSSPELVYGKHI